MRYLKEAQVLNAKIQNLDLQSSNWAQISSDLGIIVPNLSDGIDLNLQALRCNCLNDLDKASINRNIAFLYEKKCDYNNAFIYGMNAVKLFDSEREITDEMEQQLLNISYCEKLEKYSVSLELGKKFMSMYLQLTRSCS